MFKIFSLHNKNIFNDNRTQLNDYITLHVSVNYYSGYMFLTMDLPIIVRASEIQ